VSRGSTLHQSAVATIGTKPPAYIPALIFCHIFALAQSATESHNRPMTEKEIVLETIRALPDDCSIEEIAERIEFMAAVQKGLDQLDRGEGIPHDEVKRQLASWLTN
jgi:predicted transcriptional regulator